MLQGAKEQYGSKLLTSSAKTYRHAKMFKEHLNASTNTGNRI
jgi:hypothetical protein